MNEPINPEDLAAGRTDALCEGVTIMFKVRPHTPMPASLLVEFATKLGQQIAATPFPALRDPRLGEDAKATCKLEKYVIYKFLEGGPDDNPSVW